MSSGEMRGHIKKINVRLDKIFARFKTIEEKIEEKDDMEIDAIGIVTLTKLEIKEGDVLLVKSRNVLSMDAARHVTETLKELIKKAGMPECKIVIMEEIELAIMRKGEEDPPMEEETGKYILVEHGGVGWYHVVNAATGKPVWDNIFTYKDAVEKLKELFA